MASKHIDGFIQDVVSTPALMAGLTEAVGAHEGAAACEAVSAYATAKGYAVSAEDAAGLRSRVLDALGSKPLNDGDLEDVSGGISLDSLFGDHVPDNPILNISRFVGGTIDDIVHFFKQW